MDSDKNSTGESGGPGWQQRGGQPDSPSESRDNRFTTFEQDCLDELELESAEDEASSTGARSDGGSGNFKDDFIDTWSSEQSSHRLWLAFQHTASSISSLYRDHLASASAAGPGSTWYSFQTAAGACTDMYKESQEVLRVSIDEARKDGRKQLVKDLVMWMKKRGRRGRHLRREDLLAFLTGKTPPSSSRPPMTTSGSGLSSPSAVTFNSSTHHLHHHSLHHRKAAGAILSTHCPSLDSTTNHHPRRSLSASPSFTDANIWMPTDLNSSTTMNSTGCNFQDGTKSETNAFNNNNNNSGLFLEPDLRTFRDALAVQGLSGALSNIRVAGSPHSPHGGGGGGATPPLHLSTTSGGTSPLRHGGSSLEHRVRSTTPSGRQTAVSASRGGGVPQEDLHQFISDHMSMHGGAGGGAGGGVIGENADPLAVAPSFRKRSSSQSGGGAGGAGGGSYENYSPSAESPTRKRHRLL